MISNPLRSTKPVPKKFIPLVNNLPSQLRKDDARAVPPEVLALQDVRQRPMIRFSPSYEPDEHEGKRTNGYDQQDDQDAIAP